MQVLLDFQPQLGPEFLLLSKAVIKWVGPDFTTTFAIVIKQIVAVQ